MKAVTRPLGVLGTLALLSGCYSYSDPPAPRNVEPVGTRSRQMAASGLDLGDNGSARSNRSGMSGTNSDVNDDEANELQMGMPALAYAEGLGGPGFGNTRPQADLDAPEEMRNGQARGVVFKPSDHYFISGVDTGPSLDSMPGTGGPTKMRLMKKTEAREVKAAELMGPGTSAPVKPAKRK